MNEMAKARFDDVDRIKLKSTIGDFIHFINYSINKQNLIEQPLSTVQPKEFLKILKSRNSKIKFTYENIIKLIISGITYIKGLNLDDTQLNTIYINVIPSLNTIISKLKNKKKIYITSNILNVIAYNNKTLANNKNYKTNKISLSNTNANIKNTSNKTEKTFEQMLIYLMNIIDITMDRGAVIGSEFFGKQSGVTGNLTWLNSKNVIRYLPDYHKDPIGYIIKIYGFLYNRWLNVKNINYIKKYLRYAIQNPDISNNKLSQIIQQDLQNVMANTIAKKFR
jgi:hypothetical protein